VIEHLKIVVVGLSVTSSWGNGHATTYRGLVRGLAARGHEVLFLERDQPWYAANRDDPHPAGTVTELYSSFEELVRRFEQRVQNAHLVIVGSYVPEGSRVGDWVTSVARGRTAFYDIDTPVTLAKLKSGEEEYLSASQIPQYDCYLSFTGGPTLKVLEDDYGAPIARPLYCSVHPEHYFPMRGATRWDIGYLGTYSEDRQPALNALMLEPAKRWPAGRFVVAGPMYPEAIVWQSNVDRITHLAPSQHPSFYGSQRFTLNVTREAMKAAGYSPSVRLFEAAACGVPIISDWWNGLDSVFSIGSELFVAEGPEDTLRYLRDTSESQRLMVAEAARARVLAEHTPAQRALQLEAYVREMNDNFSAYTPRRNQRSGKQDNRTAIGLAS
jgi:spore maturation protein CgeB